VFGGETVAEADMVPVAVSVSSVQLAARTHMAAPITTDQVTARSPNMASMVVGRDDGVMKRRTSLKHPPDAVAS
jgi:hypothetical protein